MLGSAPCFNNLVTFDPLKSREALDTIVGDLAERWSWQDGGRTLTFSLRKGVKWHDGRPFTSRDVKYTFDMVREGLSSSTFMKHPPSSSLTGVPIWTPVLLLLLHC